MVAGDRRRFRSGRDRSQGNKNNEGFSSPGVLIVPSQTQLQTTLLRGAQSCLTAFRLDQVSKSSKREHLTARQAGLIAWI